MEKKRKSSILKSGKLFDQCGIFNACVVFFIWIAGMPVAGFSQVFKEYDGIVAVEAEHFYTQEKDDVRKWFVVGTDSSMDSEKANPEFAKSAGGGKYLIILPDTRVTREDKLIHGVNFSNEPGKMAVLHYKVHFSNPGRYYVWVRTFSTGAEDNGIHVGINGEWPESGRRMQWCEGKNQWTWASRQRTEAVHCGEEKLIYLDIPSVGEHQITFSMREDGFTFDRFVLNREYKAPVGEGPAARLIENTN